MAAAAGVSGVREVVLALREHGQDMERAAVEEVDALAQWAAARMRLGAPKFRSHLANSIRVERADSDGAVVREIRPGVRYAEAMEFGVPAGKKGLPRFEDAPADMLAWLGATPPSGASRRGGGGGLAASATAELRDRYEAMAWHIRRHGVRAHPFVAPVADALEVLAPRRMAAAVERVILARGQGVSGGGAA